MKKLRQLAEGEYFLENQPVIPKLVYGPVMYTYDYRQENPPEPPLNFLIEQIKAETSVDLENIANSYHSGGISVTKPNDIKTRHEIILFFNSTPKPLN